MERYKEYKDSGISWVGKIPCHWEVARMKRVFSEAKEKTLTEDGTLLSLSQYTGITLKDDTKKVGMFEAESTIGYNIVHPGQFVMNIMLAWNGSYAVSDYEGIISPSYCVFNFNEECERKYFHYLLRLPSYAGAFKTMSKGIIESRLRLYPLYFFTFNTIIPPLCEQKKIVNYIESKTSKIDAYIAEKEKEVQLLNELKEAEIAKVVTQGLNPNVKMKDSGISWIGMIPEHWEITKIASLFSERREKVSDKDYPALSVSKQGITPQLETAVKTDNGDNRKKVCAGDFVVNSRSDRKGSCGVSPYTGSVSLINIVLQPRNNMDGQYYHYLFRSNDYIEEYYRLGRGIVADLWTTRYSEMRNIMIPFPPINEQQAIVNYINEKCSKINSLVSDLESEIDYLKEYKQRLIADCVTGQVNVQKEG